MSLFTVLKGAIAIADPLDPTHVLKPNSDGSLPISGSTSGNAATGTVTSVNDTNTDTTILAANTARKGASIFNDSTQILFLLCAAGTSSSTNYSIQIPAGGYFELPLLSGGGVYTGILKGIWAADASGAARVTEFS